MAVTVPSEEKIYTTVYDNFKGVDYTNDPSNVWKRRSPDGLNMLPDLDGRPYKRYGWKIEIPASEFGEDVKPERLHHFSLNGLEYIMIFNDKGVFYMKTGQTGVVKCQCKVKVIIPGGEQEIITDFPSDVYGSGLPADANRSFYFEGNGTAGFYTFVGNDLFIFDGEYYKMVAPYTPTVIDAADHTGVGTPGEDINLLTEFRKITYRGDGSEYYSIPETPDTTSSMLKVEVYDTDIADWTTLTVTTDYTVSDNVIHFNEGKVPPQIDEGVNVRVTYRPSASGINYVVDSNYVTDGFTLDATQKEEYTRTKTVKIVKKNSSTGIDDRTETISAWSSPKVTITTPSKEIPIPNTYSSITVQDNLTGTWAASGSRVLATKGSYSGCVRVSADNSIAKTYGTASTSTGGWVQTSKSTKKTSTKTTTTIKYKQTKITTYAKSFNVRVAYPKYEVTGSTATANTTRTAFATCRKVMDFGNGVYNQVFLSAASSETHRKSTAWFCAKNDPSYFPDLNYIEVGADDTEVVGMIKIGSYLGFVKAGSGTTSSIYLAYPVTFDERDTFAVKQGVNGIGAISNGAFNILGGEPLFLSKDGVIGIEVSDEETDRHARNRSWFLNGKLCKEKLSSAVSYIFDGMYWLAVDGHCYVLDGSQKNSWANEKTNMQYEGYYLENIPALCFASMNGKLYFVDKHGNICRFKDDNDVRPYTDDYICEKEVVEFANFDINTGNKKDIEKMKAYIGTQAHVSDTDKLKEKTDIVISIREEYPDEHTFTLLNTPKTGTTITVNYQKIVGSSIAVPKSYFTVGTPVEDDPIGGASTKYYATYDGDATITVRAEQGSHGRLWIMSMEYYMEDGIYYIKDVDEDATEFEIIKGQPIPARWSTIADDDGAVHFFKNLQKKGCVVSLLPMPVTGATVSLKADEKEPVEIGQVEFNGGTLPHEFYIKKKLKKYKRLQIICENNDPDSGFGLDQIIKSYTMGNYSKNKG